MPSTVSDIMTVQVYSVGKGAGYREIVELLLSRGVSALPVTDDAGRVVGVVSEQDLMHKVEFENAGTHDTYWPPMRARMRARLTGGGFRPGAAAAGRAEAARADELMTIPAITVRPGTPTVEAARLIERHGTKRLPVVDSEGHLVGIVSRRDILQVFLRTDEQITADVRAVLGSASDPYRAENVTVSVRDGVATLSGRVDRRSDGHTLAHEVGGVEGVVSVVNTLSWRVDDGVSPYTQWGGI